MASSLLFPTGMKTTRWRVLIVDDHAPSRAAVAEAVGAQGGTVVGNGSRVEDAVRLVDKHRPDVVLLAVGLPDGDGVEAARRVMTALPCPIVLLTSHTDSEITAEANPGSISRNYLEELRSAGVNRLSFGAQSFDDDELRMIGRTHSAEEAREAVRAARAAGFANVSIDLIAGLPEQKMETWRRNLEEAFALEPDHLSVYLLELYKDAPLLHRINHGELRAIDDELTVEMYFALMDEAERRGFEHYEISNWARPGGFESRHNLKYWIGAPYWAFGVSAAGYDGRARWSNTRNIHEYLTRIESGQAPLVERIELDDDDRQSENLFLRLRLKDGVDLDEHLRRFGVNALERYRDEIDRLREAGLIELGENRLKISRAGTVLANEVFAAFV